MRVVLIGAGNLGIALAGRLAGEVLALTRSPARHPALRAAGARPTTTWPSLRPDDRVVLMLPGSAAQAEAVARLATGARPARAVLVGTIGLHAPYQGVIRPDSPPGEGARAAEAARAEAAFRAWVPGGVVVRCGGLWRAGRGPQAVFARTQTVPPGAPDAPLPLLHYDEAAVLVAAALHHPAPPRAVLGVTASPSRANFYAALTHNGDPAPDPPVPPVARFEDPVAAHWLAIEPQDPRGGTG